MYYYPSVSRHPKWTLISRFPSKILHAFVIPHLDGTQYNHLKFSFDRHNDMPHMMKINYEASRNADSV
jgi:hypothetical protein